MDTNNSNDIQNVNTNQKNSVDSHDENNNQVNTKQSMNADQMIMMALSGSLGIGLLIGTGSALAAGGPGSMICAYTAVALLVYNIMCAVGEVASFIPMSAGFSAYASRYVDPCLGFAVGWTYYLNYLIVTPHQITAGAMLFQYWLGREVVSPGIFIGGFYLTAFLVNMIGGQTFMKVFQYWASAVKLGFMAILMLALMVMSAGGNPDHNTIGFKYWKEPGAFKEYDKNGYVISGGIGKLVAFFTIGVTAVFSYLGVELVGVTVGDASNPRKNIPKAVKLTFFRTIGFYIVAALLLSMCVPFNDKALAFAQGSKQEVGASASAFIVAFKNMKVYWATHLINGLFIFFIIAAAIAALFIGTKTLHGLATQEKAWKFLKIKTKHGVPYPALLCTTLLCSTCFMNCFAGSAQVFEYFVSFSALLGLITWMTILFTHIRFMSALKAQGIDRNSLSYKAPFQPYSSWISLILCGLLAFSKNFPVFLRNKGDRFDWTTFTVGYIAIPMFILMCLGYKAFTKTKFVAAAEADLATGKQEVDEDEQECTAIAAAEKENHGAIPGWKKILYCCRKVLF